MKIRVLIGSLDALEVLPETAWKHMRRLARPDLDPAAPLDADAVLAVPGLRLPAWGDKPPGFFGWLGPTNDQKPDGWPKGLRALQPGAVADLFTAEQILSQALQWAHAKGPGCLQGQAWGFWGFSTEAQRIADLARALGCKIQVCDPQLNTFMAQQYRVELLKPGDLCAKSDILSFHPLMGTDRYQADARAVAKLHPGKLMILPADLAPFSNEDWVALAAAAQAELRCFLRGLASPEWLAGPPAFSLEQGYAASRTFRHQCGLEVVADMERLLRGHAADTY